MDNQLNENPTKIGGGALNSARVQIVKPLRLIELFAGY